MLGLAVMFPLTQATYEGFNKEDFDKKMKQNVEHVKNLVKGN